jgi:EAL domain-containing protein (putative c-di-GMP-specific phosphodiesterase class I)
MRWKHPENGLMYPNDFIPLAEETGAIILMGEWILRAACRQNVQWRKNGLSPCRVAVNLSPRQFGEEKLANTVRHILDDTGMDPEYLELEITEGSTMQDLDYTVATLRSLKKMGVGIAIDDFGGGYSSFNYLKRFPIDLLKIDQSFIHDVPEDPVNAAIISAMVALGRGLGLTTIAEGVEKESQLEFLRSVQCDEIQGFYFSRPLPVEGIEKLLQSNNRKFW